MSANDGQPRLDFNEAKYLASLERTAPTFLPSPHGKWRAALELIRDFPIPEQDDMHAANMRWIAREALG